MKGAFRLRFLGTVQVTRDGSPVRGFRSRKALALLGYLAVQDQPTPRDRLSDLFWPDHARARGRANLSWVLSRITSLLPDCLQADRHAVQCHCPAHFWLDIQEFAELESRGDAASLAAAAELVRGQFLEDLCLENCAEFELWLVGERERWHRRTAGALGTLVSHHSRRAEYAEALRYGRRLLDLEPWREAMHRQAMRLLAWDGQRGAALAQYAACCRALAGELGVLPAPQTTYLYEQIRTGELELPPATALPDSYDQPVPFLDAGQKARVEPPVFVAREPQLARLFAFLDAALTGQTQLVFVTGGAGRGKTALLNEFARHALDRHTDLLFAVGDCTAYSGVGDPYLPFRGVMAMLTGDVETRWQAGTITRDHTCRLWKMSPHVLQILVNRGPQLVGTLLSARDLMNRARAAALGRVDWLERLADLTEHGETERSALEQSHFFEQYTNVLRDLAARCPLLLLLDDLQWVDAASAGLLLHLSRRLARAGSRILIACAYRPDEVDLGRPDAAGSGRSDRHPLESVLAESKRRFGDTSVDLGRVDEAQGRRLVEAFLDTEPNRLGEGFRTALFRQTGGHPLFTVELLRAMQQRGDLVQDDRGRWMAGPALDWRSLPPRVEAVIEQRLERLPSALRDMLTAASVEGEAFTAQVLARVQQAPERQILHTLSQRLERRHRLVRAQGEVQVGDRCLSRYRFAHSMFQQYLYDHLAQGQCRLLHREVAAALEQLYEGQTEEIAVHLVRHYAGDIERERHYARLAGERAAAQFAHVEALRYLNQALTLTPEDDLAARFELLLAREKTYGLQGERAAQAADLATLERLAERLNDNWRRVKVALRKGEYCRVTADFTQGLDHLECAMDWARTTGDRQSEAAVHRLAGAIHASLGSFDLARDHCEQALAIYRATDNRLGEAQCLASYGAICCNTSDYAVAQEFCMQALALSRVVSNRPGERYCLHLLGHSSRALGRLAGALEYNRQALAIARTMGDRYNEAWLLLDQGGSRSFLGDHASAREVLEQALEVFSEIKDQRGQAYSLNDLGVACSHLHDFEVAKHYSEQAQALFQSIGDRRGEAASWNSLGLALEGLGELDTAARAYGKALAINREIAQPVLATEDLAGLARVALAQGRVAEALEVAEQILDTMSEHGIEYIGHLLPAHLVAYQVLAATGYGERARKILAKAHALLTERADRLDDVEFRRSFLDNVAAHREIVMEWEKARPLPVSDRFP